MGAWHREVEGAVTILTLTRPPINALDGPALEELGHNLTAIAADAGVRVLVITGGHGRVFCAGGDLEYWKHISDGCAVRDAGRRVFAQLASLELPTVAAINGHVVGDGLALALACDLRWVADDATFRLPELRYGFIPGWGTLEQLIRLIGRSHATDLLLTGRALGAAAAEAMGLVHAVVPRGRLPDEARLLGWVMAALPPAAVRAAKRALKSGEASAAFAGVWGSAEWVDGMKAFHEERVPRARGIAR